MRKSRFINLTQYCIAEYMFDQLGSLDFYTDDFVLFEHNDANLHQIVNTDASYSSTKNIKDLTAVPIGGNTYVYIDSEKIPNYIDYAGNITVTPITGYNVVMDKVRFHFVAGFDFDSFRALILSIKNTENDGKINLFANILLSPETIDRLISFNPKPLFLGNALYDRYIDILVPSIKNINEEYRTAVIPANTFVAAITPNELNSTGFIYNAPLTISLAECTKATTIYSNVGTTYQGYEATEIVEASLSQSNEFDNTGAFINEAADGDFIEFYLTYNSGFPEELISTLNLRNPADDWIIVHQLSIYEQIGSSFINTSRFVFFQEDRFDEPCIYRPVLRNANEAVSMSIDYLARLTNRRNGEQIIREGSFSLISPKKYGKKLITMPLLDKPQSQRIYNKIVKKNFEATKLFIEPTLNTSDTSTTTTTNTVVRTEYVPIFFNNNNISISNVNSLIKNNDKTEEVIFGPSKLRFILSPFDNILKLKVYTSASSISSNTLIPLDLNISSAKYRLVFETNHGNISIDNANNANLENLSTGVIVFNISKKDSEAILKSDSRITYLVSVSQDNRETLIYSAQWRKSSEYADVELAIKTAKDEANASSQIQSTLNEINQNIQNTTVAQSTIDSEAYRAAKALGVPSIVNKFGVSAPSTIQPNAFNAGLNS